MRKRGRPPYPDILTPREWEVLGLVREGLTNEQIAERLNITIHSARYHVSEILSKLGVDSRREAAAWRPERARPFWARALAFALWPVKHLPFGLAVKASAAVAVVGVAGGIGFLAWGVVVTGGPGGDNMAALLPSPTGAVTVTATAGPPVSATPYAQPTPTISMTPLSTPTLPAATPPPTTTAAPEPTATPEASVCPPPARTSVTDFANPPPTRPVETIAGQHVQGGTSYSEGYVTVQLPAGREFIIFGTWSQDESNLVIDIYDARSGSELGIRGDGCETSRFLRDPAADAVFDEVMQTVKVGSGYVCPTAARVGPDEAGPGLPESAMGGPRVEGGAPLQLAGATLHLPAGRQFIISQVLADPGGPRLSIYDVGSRSSLAIRPGDVCELGRWVRDLAVDPIFDQIVSDLQAAAR